MDIGKHLPEQESKLSELNNEIETKYKLHNLFSLVLQFLQSMYFI
jgi:hypothetical protein